jgi:anhydro-N-acetylmuramic acid kinase
MTLYVGLMSGTSLDGVDGVLVDLTNAAAPRVLAHHHCGFNSALKSELLGLNQPSPNELHRSALAANALAESYAEVIRLLLDDTGTAANSVRAVGAHGQTVRHRPGEFDGRGYTLQLHNGALLAELSGIDVVCDFRSRDVAAGGQGAPLVPAFHAAAFGRLGKDIAVLNLGGISNLSLLSADGGVRGFDCGPGNALLDAWCQRHRGQAYDAAGCWAAGGQPLPSLLAAMQAEPFLHRMPPKSTGRDLFNADWLNRSLAAAHVPTASPQDVQATLAELTCHAVSQDLRRHAPATEILLVCGGGAYNLDLLARLRRMNVNMRVQTTDEYGLPADQVEAIAFAWLAHAFLERQPGSRPEVTGARGARLLGALYPA